MSTLRSQCLGGIGDMSPPPPLPPEHSYMQLQIPESSNGYYLFKKDTYCRVPIVATLVTFGISSLLGSRLSGGRYFRGTQIEYQ